MGEAALRSHEKSDSRRQFSESDASQVSMDKFTVPPPPSSTTKTKNPSTSGLEKFVSKTDVLKAEVMWTIQTVVNHNSYKSNETVGLLFKAIFPDSVRLLKSSHVANARLHISLCLGLLSILDP